MIILTSNVGSRVIASSGSGSGLPVFGQREGAGAGPGEAADERVAAAEKVRIGVALGARWGGRDLGRERVVFIGCA